MTLKTLCAASALAVLASCGPLGQGVTTSTFTSVAAPLFGTSDNEVEVAAPQAQLTRAAIEASDAELMLVSLVSRASVDVMTRISTSSRSDTWISTDGVSVTLVDGMIVASRGTGFDLMGADTAAARQSLRRGGSHTRTYDFLDSLDQIVTEQFNCEMTFLEADVITIVERTYSTRKWREDCAGSGVRFANLYWVGPSGQIVQSRQYLSTGIGYIVFQPL
ncbi:YjbF family lipoprotein [Pseudooctadecabacter jejudonensis]|uniref:Group 4 capsule polysaccharide lipoprotein gfcB, YjbF n=1 Tax=Pseudooctadecabacter jejudonensis TaxID=1391910 RepID=A0A1Y5SDF4_9RHOB|nr:YjbF family lipoprotein [Pseudooctadecabacter jejudonensis]SLN35404.1 hypothetical protein PSJ8397_01776 [Pseudooctadecabacter jejudonensis]